MRKFLSMALLGGMLALSGCGDDRDEFVFTTNQVAAPVAVADAYTVNANTTLAVSVANSVLVNDTVNGAVPTFPATTSNGGTITGLADGTFSYSPPLDFFGSDSFSYTLANSAGTSTTTVTITVAAVNAFIVDAATGDDTTGNFINGRPFATLQVALAAAPAGSDVIVRPGSYTGTVTLKNGDRLLGSGSTLVNAQGEVRPVLSGPVVLADGNTVDFLRIENSPGDAIDGDDQNGGTVTNCEIDTTTLNLGSGIQAQDVSGDWTITNNTITNVLGAGIDFRVSGSSVAVARINNNVVTNNDFNAIGFITSDSSDLRAQVTGNTMTGNEVGFTFEVIAGGASTSIYDIEDNTNDDVYLISQNPSATGDLEVEEWDNLIAVNNNSGTKATSLGSNPPVSVPNGTAGF